MLWKERIKAIPFGMYQSIRTMIDNSQRDLEELLKTRMLENDNDKDAKATEIANYLNKGDTHTSHGKGINIKTAADKGLKVKNLHDEKEMEDLVLTIYHICSRLFETSQVQKIIINHAKTKYFVSI